ncbi:hypothetical protein BKK51_04745 [Rodentibacter trehalosifermentans]|uniref:Uncharacterized protein n=1 Tax=Rodentibacter trehalosifermentans TaxID=1908263 RepID=A0A1V3IV91_9PAST|nr:hypothetical protein BKK51_04745 [Rodentibacter trehalosifermentans]OOF50225.1 hypothetical protein BKK52_02155 [Rodentibacter trehalosifermentans]OOF52911.1 hypothetical protein BKK53_03010 [Rodentibacter trehalosifermentans]
MGFYDRTLGQFLKKRADYSRFWAYAKDENKTEQKKVNLLWICNDLQTGNRVYNSRTFIKDCVL